MQNHKLIQNINIFPDTHFFLYKNKKYPFKYDFFKYSSKYFENNHIEIKQRKCINLLESESEKELDISDDIIYNFINFIQGQQISLTNENVLNLNYLANVYEVPSLKEFSEEYINEHHQDLVIDVLSSKKYILKDDIELYENILSEHLSNYIDDERLSNLEVSTIYRVLHKNENQNKIDKQKLADFLFKCLEKHGKKASVLFTGFNFSELGSKYLNRLLSDYSSVFDFHFLGSSMVQTMYNEESSLMSKIIMCEKKEKENENAINDLREKLDKIMSELNQTKEDKERQLLEFQQREDQSKKKEKEHEETIKNLQQKVDEIRNELNQTKEEKEKEILEFQQREDQFKKEQKEAFNIITHEMNELKNIMNQIKLEQNQIKENTTTNKKESVKIFEYQNGKEFDGIMRYLTNKTGGNIHDNGTIEITSNQNTSWPPRNLVDYEDSNYYRSEDDGYAIICFDFKDKSIELTSYAIQSRNNEPNNVHLRNWVIEISNDGNKWTEIDRHQDDSTLNGYSIKKIFHIKNENKYFSRFIRLRQTGNSWYDSDNHNIIGFPFIEFYGKLENAPF